MTDNAYRKRWTAMLASHDSTADRNSAFAGLIEGLNDSRYTPQELGRLTRLAVEALAAAREIVKARRAAP